MLAISWKPKPSTLLSLLETDGAGRNDGLFSVSLPRCSAERGVPLFSVSLPRCSADRGRNVPLFSVSLPRCSADRGRNDPLFSVSLPRCSDRYRGVPLFSVSLKRTPAERRAFHSSQSPCQGARRSGRCDVVAAHAQCKVEASEHTLSVSLPRCSDREKES